MAERSSRGSKALEAFRRRTTMKLKSHPTLRAIWGLSGVVLFLYGFLSIPLIEELSGPTVWKTCMAAGLAMIGIWYLSGHTEDQPPTTLSDLEVDHSADLVPQLRELAELHTSGALTDQEFESAKAQILK